MISFKFEVWEFFLELQNVIKKKKKKTITCDIGTAQCEDGTIKCEKNETWYSKLPTSG